MFKRLKNWYKNRNKSISITPDKVEIPNQAPKIKEKPESPHRKMRHPKRRQQGFITTRKKNNRRQKRSRRRNRK